MVAIIQPTPSSKDVTQKLELLAEIAQEHAKITALKSAIKEANAILADLNDK